SQAQTFSHARQARDSCSFSRQGPALLCRRSRIFLRFCFFRRVDLGLKRFDLRLQGRSADLAGNRLVHLLADAGGELVLDNLVVVQVPDNFIGEGRGAGEAEGESKQSNFHMHDPVVVFLMMLLEASIQRDAAGVPVAIAGNCTVCALVMIIASVITPPVVAVRKRMSPGTTPAEIVPCASKRICAASWKAVPSDPPDEISPSCCAVMTAV